MHFFQIDTFYLYKNELVLDCRVRGNPRPEITWMKGMDLITNDLKYSQLDEADGHCRLVISAPTQKDSGIYTCQARNTAGLSEKLSHQVDFKGVDNIIHEKASGFFRRDPNKPHFASPIGDHTVSDGGCIALTAEMAPSTTPLEVQWFRDKKPLTGPKIKAFYDRNLYYLTVTKADINDEGQYTCRAANAFGHVETNSNVDMVLASSNTEVPPLFLSRPDNEMKIAVNDPFSIAFRIQGEPAPRCKYYWG